MLYSKFYLKIRPKLLNLDLYEKLLPSGRIVDVGCGYGVLANYLAKARPDCEVIGIDQDPERVKVARQGSCAKFMCFDARIWAIPPCNGITMTDFLHHLPLAEHEPTIRRAFNSLSPGGVLLISDVDATRAFGAWMGLMFDYVAYKAKSYFRTPSDWERILRGAGFTVKTIKIKSLLFAPIVFICRRPER